MPRGITPRRPSRSGLHTRVARPSPAVQKPVAQARSQRAPRAGVERPSAVQERVAQPSSALQSLKGAGVAGARNAGPAAAKGRGKPAPGYNPVAPERIAEILQRLDARYPA